MVDAGRQLGDLVATRNGQRFREIAPANIADMGNDAAKRIKKDMTNAVPHGHQHDDKREGEHRHLPFRETVVVLALRKGGVIKLAAGFGVLAERRAEGVLHALGRLREIGVHIALLQELHQLREAGEVGQIFFIYVRARLRHCGLRGDFFEGLVMFRRVCQRGARILQQFRFCAALLVVRIHHHAGRRAAQIDTRLQHQIPGCGQFALLHPQIVRGREAVLVLF